MKQLRCSIIYSHTFTEHMMIASASAYYLGSGISVVVWSHWFNTFVQVATEVATDLLAFYVEIIRHKMPVVVAWDRRHPNWLGYFSFFIISINIVIVAHGGMYYCALRNPDDAIS